MMPPTADLLRNELNAAVAAAAFLMGGVHALSPGHGKTLVAAYLVGSRGSLRHAALLGVSVTVTHTISVFALGFVTLFLSRYVLPQEFARLLQIASGLSIVIFGAWLLHKRLRARREAHHHHHHHNHRHDGDLRLGALLALGAGGGLSPCPSALVLMLSAISLGKAALGVVLLVSFSAGLAAVLIAIGAAVLYARRLAPPELPRLRWLPVVSAGVILAAGVMMTGAALR